MKRFYRLLCAVLAAMLAIGVATVFTACSETNDTPPTPPKEYTITLMLNEEQAWDSFTGKAGDAVKFEKGMPSRNNSVLKGWSTSPAGEPKQLPSVMPESDQTYYAIFVRYYNLTLRAGAGTLEGEDNIRAEEGQNLYSLVKDIAPTAPGSSAFDGWYYGNKKIDDKSSDAMPANTITLDAKYTVDYTINIFKQNDYKSDDYTKVAADTVQKSGFLGSSPRDSEYPSYAGFEFDEQKSGATSDFVLSATGSNVFNAYYNIQAYRLVFNPNTPVEGLSVSGSMGTAEWGYNVENTIPDCEYTISGYRFSHWATTADGSDRINVGDKYKITDSTTLYAVWTRGYGDLTGRSYDYIYLVENNDGGTVAYLDRYYLDELEGTYDKATNTVSFKENGKVILHGKLDLKGYTFTYINAQAYVLHGYGKSDESMQGYLDEAVTLTLGDNGSAVYSDNGSKTAGTYALDAAEQSMKFTANDGGKTFYFRLSQHRTDGGNIDVFEVRSEAEVGEWCRLTDNYPTGSDYADDSFVLELNGYGEAIMHAKGKVNSAAYDYSGYYRYVAGSPEGRPEIYTMFITSYDSKITRIVLVDRTATAAEDAEYKKFYKEWEFSTTAYAKPADGEELDIETADRVVLDGYGLYDDSAKFTSGDSTVSGKYTFNWTNRTLEFGGATYFVDIQTVGEGDEARSYLVYEPLQTGKDELNKLYAIEGLENSFRPGMAYGFRFFNDNEALLYVWMPDIDRAYNTLNASLQPVIGGTYTSLGGGEYLFQADIAPEAVALIKYYYTALFNFQVGLDISGFGDFKFKFTGSTAGEVTALGDGFDNISVVDNGATYVTDGYGKAKVTNEQGIVTATRDYVVLNTMGLPCLYLVWKETELDINNKPVEVSKQKMYTLIDGEYRAYVDEYGKYNTQYSAQIPDTTFRIVVYEGDYAVLAYDDSTTRRLVIYSWGKVDWTDGATKKFGTYEECGYIGDGKDVLSDLYGDFKFGLKEVKIQGLDGKETTAIRMFTYDAPASDVVDGVFVIDGGDGTTLTVDLNKCEAYYTIREANDIKVAMGGEFKLRENVLTIVYGVEGEDGKTYVRSNAFKLVYENGEIASFLPVGVEAGTWFDATGVNGSILLSGEAASVEGEYLGTWYGYDRETDSIMEINGTYARTDNEETVEYVFKFTVDPTEGAEGDDGKRSFNFALGYDSAKKPIYRIYSMPAYVVLYGSLTSTMPSYMIRGGGYSDLVLIDTYSNQTVGQLLIYPNANLMLKDAVLYAFGTNELEPEPLLFFTIIGEGDDMRGIILDSTFIAENFGRFDCEDSRELTVPVLKDSESKEYVDVKITPDKIFFNGLGTAMVIDSKNDRALPVMYLRYNTNTYALVSVSDDNINIIALLRLYTSTKQVTGDDGETTTETQYIVRFDDAELRRTFKGAGHTAFITDGFSSATYADERGWLHVCTYKRLEDNPEVVAITYLDGLQLAYMYIEVDAKKGTFTVLSSDDSRIPVKSEQEEESDD